jgi:ribonuclease HI
MLILKTDGAIEPSNPGGWACYGWVAYDPSLGETEEIASGYGSIGEGPGMTNNIAEYWAIIHALRWVYANGNPPVLVQSDSQLVVNHINRVFSCNDEKLIKLLARVRMAQGLMDARFEWVEREKNKRADQLSRTLYRESGRPWKEGK